MESSYGGTDYTDELGQTRKAGILKKKSPVLGLWKTRFVVLDGNTLKYYKSEDQFNSGAPGKTMTLSESSMTTFTPVANCFSIRQSDPLSRGVGASKSTSSVRRSSLAATKSPTTSANTEVTNDQWWLTAENETEMYEWVVAISAHIHVIHMQAISYSKTLPERMANGTSGTFFYEAPTSANGGEHRLPIGLRTIPERTGPRTGDVIYPGEIFEAVHRCEVEGQAYLRLAGNRGWLFENHPASGEALVNTASSGLFTAKNTKYSYPNSDSVRSHKCMLPSVITSHYCYIFELGCKHPYPLWALSRISCNGGSIGCWRSNFCSYRNLDPW